MMQRAHHTLRRLGTHSLMASMVLFAAAACSGQSSPAAAPTATDSPPTAVPETSDASYAIIRIPVEANASGGLATAVSRGKRNGQINYALWLDSTQSEKAGFSSVVVVGFAGADALSAWRNEAAPELAPPAEVHLADRLYHVENPGRDSSIAVFQGNYMEPKVSREDFSRFTEDYMRKYLELQREAGILTSYSMYLEHEAPAGSGLAFMIREHTDQHTFDDRNSTKDRLRDELMARDADYKKLEDTAIEYRVHVSGTRARHVPLP